MSTFAAWSAARGIDSKWAERAIAGAVDRKAAGAHDASRDLNTIISAAPHADEFVDGEHFDYIEHVDVHEDYCGGEGGLEHSDAHTDYETHHDA